MAISITAQLAARIAEKRGRLDAHRPLAADVLRYLHADMRIVQTYHSNAIEGNTLDLRETRLVIADGVAAGDHSLREYRETTNHAAAFDYLEQLVDKGEPLDAEAVLGLHRLVMHELIAAPGELRSVSVHIRGASWTPPPAAQVPRLLNEWLGWVAEGGQEHPPIVRAAIAHSQFEAIHPFVDGNGRVGRLLLNMMLMQDGYPPALILREWRREYIDALEVAQVASRYRPIANLVARAVEQGLDLYLSAVDAAETALIPLPELAAEFGYSVNYLGGLSRDGRLAATKRGGRWYARRSDVAEYKQRAGEERRGRPRSG